MLNREVRTVNHFLDSLGIGDMRAASRNGYSTTKSAGTGLDAAMGLSDRFDIHSQGGKGTAVLTWTKPSRSGKRETAAEAGSMGSVVFGAIYD